MTGRRLAWGAAFVIPVILALTWLALPTAPGPEQTGLIQIPAIAPPPATGASPTVTPARTRRIPIIATQEDVTLADDQSLHILREKRDRLWAERSETAIGNFMRGIVYVGGRRRLEVKCAATLCEVTGLVDVDPMTGSYQAVWEALERDTAGNDLGKYGLERTAAVFDTGRNPDEFKIQYRRVEALPKL